MFSSWVLERIAIGDTHRLRTGVNSVGRHSSSLIRILDSHYVSRHHAEIEVSSDNKMVTIKDLNSVNGIFVNTTLHKCVTVALSKGDKIGIGVSVDGSEEEDELSLPIYELKYLPIIRARSANAAFLAKPCDLTQPIVKEEKDEKPSTSRNSSIAVKPIIMEEILIVSDDDEYGSGCGGSKKDTAEANNKAKENLTTNDNVQPVTTVNKVNNANKNQTLTSKEDAKVAPLTDKDNPLADDSKAGSADNAKENNLHLPIISNVKKEYIRSLSANVKNIFGDLDDDEHMKDKLKEINPLVYNDLSGKPLLPITNVNTHLINGDCIILSDDDAMEEEELGVIIPSTSKNSTERENKMDAAKSPNLFLDSSKEDENELELEPLKKVETTSTDITPNQSKTNERLITSTDNIDLDDYTSFGSNAGDEDMEELMFSQVLINDMKAELQDDVFNNDFDGDLPQEDEQPSSDKEFEMPIKIKQEPDLERNASLLNELENSCWVISDDEDYDAELESKVTDWSNKIFSQSFGNISMSQVYDIDTPNIMDDDDDEEDEHDDNRNNGHDDFNIIDDDIDNIADLYNNSSDEQAMKIDERLQELNEEIARGQEADLQQLRVKIDTNLEKDHMQEVLETIKTSSIMEQEDEVIPLSQKRFSSTNKTEEPTTEQLKRKKSIEEKNNEYTLKLKPLKVLIEALQETSATPMNVEVIPQKAEKSFREKSPDEDMLHFATDTDSPLIRVRRKSSTSAKLVASLSSSEDEDDNFVPHKPEQLNNLTVSHKENINKPTTIRPPPQIIDAPSLPKCKGKLRGVCAEKPSPILSVKHKKSSASTIRDKITSIRDQIRSDHIAKDLKRKWVEKPTVHKKRDKERIQKIKESRKDKLKELAEKNKSPTKDSLKRKNYTGFEHEDIKAKKAKVKITTQNRGAFLAVAEAAPSLPKPKENHKSQFKIPKVVNKKPEEIKNDTAATTGELKNKEPLKRCNSTDEIKKTVPLKRTMSIDASFSQQISMPDDLLFKRSSVGVGGETKKAEFKAPPPKRTSETVCKEAVAARAIRTTNKITFASMEKNIIDTEACKQKLSTICSKRSSISQPGNKLSNLTNNKSVTGKKTVRFNDTPIIHYIERICGASRRVVGKDILPQTTHKDRRQMIRRNYPILDNTDKIISKILCWSNEWLKKRDAAADAASDVVYPMPTHFSSFDHYKSILFPLMKLEFASLLERQYHLTLSTKKYNVSLEYVTVNKDRLMLVTKYHYQNRQQLDSTKYDLVILESKQMNNNMFAYLTSVRKGAGSCNTMVFEILPMTVTKEFFSGIKSFTIRPVIDNVRVEFGAFNAVYQLEATPLFQKILNPLELLQYRQTPKKKSIYRGCDQLNDKQRQVLLNTYLRVIDETTPNISLIQGPPGTGKSCVITNLALQTLYGDEVRYLDKKILICAQSNAAVDVIAGKLFDISMRMRPERRFRLIRYGLPEKINPRVNPVSLIHIVEQEMLKKLKTANANVQVENKENLKNQILLLEAEISEMSKRNIKGTVEEDMLLEKQRQLNMMRNITNQLTRPEDERSLYTWYLNNANIVCATLSSCVKLAQFVNYFDICIIDEATQSTEPWTLLPLRFGINSLVLVGDTQQLPATILSKKANELGLGKSMFTRIQNCLDNVPSGTNSTGGGGSVPGVIPPSHIIFGLQTQYRMNPEICKWPNQYFYRSELINGSITNEFKSPLKPFSVLNLAYSQNEYCSNGKITNNLEAEFVAKLLKALDGFIPNKYNSYGVITPYAHHRTTLENSIRSLGLTNIMVNTIDSYQGLEKDVIVISNARTNGIGFLSNPQRLNVALTRPKKCLILCGNFKSLEVVPAWRCLLQSARERHLYYEISTNCVNDIHTNVIDKIKIKQ